MSEPKFVNIVIEVLPQLNMIRTYHSLSYKAVYIAAGYCSDGLSKLINKYQPRCLRAAIVHDYICDTKVLTRRTGDRYFHEIMLLDGTPPWKARLMWLAVRGYALATFQK